MKLTDMINCYAMSPRLKAKLKKKIMLDNGDTLKKGCVSELLILKPDGTYHFEANHTACVVTKEEIQFF